MVDMTLVTQDYEDHYVKVLESENIQGLGKCPRNDVRGPISDKHLKYLFLRPCLRLAYLLADNFQSQPF